MMQSKSLEKHEQMLKNHAKSVYKDRLLKVKNQDQSSNESLQQACL